MKKTDYSALYLLGGLGLVVYLLKEDIKKMVGIPIIEDKLRFLKNIKPIAELIQKQYGIKSIITISQSAHESNWGISKLTKDANNLFGMKATAIWIKEGKPVWTGATTEYFDPSQPTKIIAGFKKYSDWLQSTVDWAELISNISRYSTLIKYAKEGNIDMFGKEITKSGYATDPKYYIALNNISKEIIKYV